MNHGIGAILKQVAKTALLVLSLGMLLFGALTVAVEQGNPRLLAGLLGLSLACLLAAGLAFVAFEMLRTGRVTVWRPGWGPTPTREGQPLAYWFHVGWYALGALLAGAIAIRSGAIAWAAM